MRGWNDVMEFRVDGSAIGAAVDSLYKKASPLIAAQATIVTQIEICRINNDKKNIEKWSKVLSILEEKEVKISVGKTGY